MTDTVVVGIGNPLMSDDGIGDAVVGALHEAGVDERSGIDVCHAGTTALFALEAMSGAGRAIVVDAIEADSPPGTIQRYRYDGERFDGFDDVTMHDFTFTDALTVADDVYDVPDDIVLLGVVPESLAPGEGLSDRLEQCLPEIVDAVLDELAASQQIDS